MDLFSHLALPVLFFPLLLSGCGGTLNVSEKMMWSTYPLATHKGAATGFVINHRDAASPGGVVPVVFTSVHVLDTLGGKPLIIGIRTPAADGEVDVALLAYLPPKMPGNQRFYVRHPQQDIAAFPLRLPQEMAGVLGLSTFLSERMLARNSQVLRSGVDVSFLGYPEPLPGTEGAFAVLRSGRVASYPVGTRQAHGRFLINSDVYPGDSGAPVFISRRGGRPELVGMIIQRIGENAGSFSHLAIAVDAGAIRETLNLLVAEETKSVHLVKDESSKPAR